MNRTRVLIFVSGLAIGSTAGGAERYGVEVACRLDHKLIEPVVCAFWRRGVPEEAFWADALSRAGVECFFAVDRGTGFSPKRFWQAIKRIVATLDGRPVDVIHSHFQLGSVTALCLCRLVGARRLIRTAHGAVRWEWRDTWLGALCRLVFTMAFFPAFYDVEVGVSAAAVASLDRRFVARVKGKRALLIPNAIDPARFRRAVDTGRLKAELGLGTNTLVVGSVGRLSEQKGYRYLVEAAPFVLEALPNCVFVLVGDGELRDALETQVGHLGVASAFRFVGARQDTQAMYGAMDVFACPSLFEGLPTVVLEAMASNVPIVATSIPGIEELVSDGVTGRLVCVRDPRSLADALIGVLQSPDRGGGMARKALSDVVPRYSICEVAQRYERLYRVECLRAIQSGEEI